MFGPTRLPVTHGYRTNHVEDTEREYRGEDEFFGGHMPSILTHQRTEPVDYCVQESRSDEDYQYPAQNEPCDLGKVFHRLCLERVLVHGPHLFSRTVDVSCEVVLVDSLEERGVVRVLDDTSADIFRAVRWSGIPDVLDWLVPVAAVVFENRAFLPKEVVLHDPVVFGSHRSSVFQLRGLAGQLP